MPKVLPKQKLPYNATLATALEGLGDPEDYVRHVFARLGKRLDLRQVRIGVTSDTEAPDYAIDEFMGNPDDPDDLGQPVLMEAFSGGTHKELSYAKTGQPLNWSTEGMSWVQVQGLLASLRSGQSAIAAAAIAKRKT